MKYKAIIADLDGTLIKDKSSLPTQKTIKSVKRAMNLVNFSIATSKPFHLIKDVCNIFDISSPIIINGGAQIINPQTEKIIWQKAMNNDTMNQICKIAIKNKINFLIHDQKINFAYTKSYTPKDPLYFWVNKPIPINVAREFTNELKIFDSIHIAFLPTDQDNKIEMLITHADANKQYAIFKLGEILDISTHEMIAVGDGYNDFPLLMACGLKVAMGNAVPELKEIADYIAPSVEEDGVADVIEKFVLNQ